MRRCCSIELPARLCSWRFEVAAHTAEDTHCIASCCSAVRHSMSLVPVGSAGSVVAQAAARVARAVEEQMMGRSQRRALVCRSCQMGNSDIQDLVGLVALAEGPVGPMDHTQAHIRRSCSLESWCAARLQPPNRIRPSFRMAARCTEVAHAPFRLHLGIGSAFHQHRRTQVHSMRRQRHGRRWGTP